MAEGFEALGQPVPAHRRQAGYAAVKEMRPGVDPGAAMDAVDKMAYWIQRDEPYTAQAVVFSGGTKITRDPSSPRPPDGVPSQLRLDYTGMLRLFCTLLTAPEPDRA